MKKNFFFPVVVTISLLTGTCFAQSGNGAVDPKILEVYGSSWNDINTQDPERAQQLTNLLQNRVQILDMDSTSAKDKFPSLASQPLFTKYVNNIVAPHSFDAATFNPLIYDLKFFENGDSGYWINGTNKVLFITGHKNSASN